MYKTKILVQDSYEIYDVVGDENSPIISSVVLNENTAIDEKLTLGGTASNALSFNLKNSPIENLDGLKVQLFVMEDSSDDTLQEDISLSTDIESVTDIEDIADIEDDSAQDLEPTEEDEEAFNAEFDLEDITDIDDSSAAETLEIDDDSEADVVEDTEGENTEYREEDIVEDVVAGEAVATDSDEWLSMGVFYITSVKANNDSIDITAYDSFILMNDEFTPVKATATIAELYEEFTTALNGLGIEVMEEQDFSDTVITWSGSYTLREAAGIFASFLGGYACFTRGGEFDIRRYLKDTYEIQYVDIKSFNETLSGGLNIDSLASAQNVNKTAWLISPSDATSSSNTAVMFNPFMTQDILDELLPIYQNLIYQPCTLSCDYFEGLEAGDIVKVYPTLEDNYWINITNLSIDFSSGLASISSLGGSETNCNYVSPINKMIQEASKTATNYITTAEDGALLITRDLDSCAVRIDADSVDITQDGEVVSSFGEDVTIGSESNSHISLSPTEFNIYSSSGASIFNAKDSIEYIQLNMDNIERQPSTTYTVTVTADSTKPPKDYTSTRVQLCCYKEDGSLVYKYLKYTNGDYTVSYSNGVFTISGTLPSDADYVTYRLFRFTYFTTSTVETSIDGDLEITGKLTVGLPLLRVSQNDIYNISVAASASTATGDIDCTISSGSGDVNYKPVGIVGVNTSGTASTSIVLYRYFLLDDSTIRAYARNTSSTKTTNYHVTFYVLWALKSILPA